MAVIVSQWRGRGVPPAGYDIQSDIIGALRYVLDTCVVASALRSRNGASNRVLRLALLGEIPAVCHYKLLSEYCDVLFRMVRRGEVAFSRSQVERFLAALVTVAEELEVRYFGGRFFRTKETTSSMRRLLPLARRPLLRTIYAISGNRRSSGREY